jgi:hypothetical protein
MTGQGRVGRASIRCSVAMSTVVLGGGCDPTWTDPRVTGVPSFSVREVRYLRFTSARRDATGATVESARGTSTLFTIGPTPGMVGGGSPDCRFRMRAASTPEVLVEAIDPCIRDTTPAVFRLTARGTATQPGVPASRLDFQSAENTIISPPGDPLPIRVPLVQQHVNVWIEPTRGRWIAGRGNPQYEHNIVAAHSVLMPTTNGSRLLWWSPARRGDLNADLFDFTPGGPNGGFQWLVADVHAMENKVWDPSSGTFEIQPQQHFGNRGINLFCAGQVLLPDGRALIAGGHIGGLNIHSAAWVHTFSLARPLGSRIVRQSGELQTYRWYPTVTVLPGGRALIHSGNRSPLGFAAAPNAGLITPGYIDDGSGWYGVPRRSDIFDPVSNSLQAQDSLPTLIDDGNQGLYPAVFVLPSSTVSASGPKRYLPESGALFVVERTTGYLFAHLNLGGGRSGFFPQRLTPQRRLTPPYSPIVFPVYPLRHRASRSYPTWGNAVVLPIDARTSTRARVLVAGGRAQDVDAFRWWKSEAATASAEIFDYDANEEIDQQRGWRPIAPMRQSRVIADATLLADGRVLVSGGASGGWANDPGTPVREPESFDPESETWFTMEPSPTNRLYHATAVLLPDGTVLTSGSHGGFEPRLPTQNVDPQFHSDVFLPPYLFRSPPPRVWIDGATSGPLNPERVAHRWQYGSEQIIVAQNDEPSSFRVALVRYGGVTHGNNMDQRFVWLSPTSVEPVQGDNAGAFVRMRVAVPTDRALLVPGHYMVFVLNDRGVPSEARFMVLR